MNEVADSKAYKEFYYNNALSEGYKEGNSFEDFLNDLKEGHILIRFGTSFEERNDKKYIMEFCKEIVKNPKLFEPIFFRKNMLKNQRKYKQNFALKMIFDTGEPLIMGTF
mgnify:CR=1 FL=1